MLRISLNTFNRSSQSLQYSRNPARPCSHLMELNWHLGIVSWAALIRTKGLGTIHVEDLALPKSLKSGNFTLTKAVIRWG